MARTERQGLRTESIVSPQPFALITNPMMTLSAFKVAQRLADVSSSRRAVRLPFSVFSRGQRLCSFCLLRTPATSRLARGSFAAP